MMFLMYDYINNVLEKGLHGLPRYVGIGLAEETRSISLDMLHLSKENLVVFNANLWL